MSGGILGLLFSQFFLSLPKPAYSYTGKTVIVTGSNVGLGKEAARHFTRLGASTIILAVRSLDKGNAAKEEIEMSTRVKNVVKVWQLDMGSYKSVQDFAAKVEKELSRLDIAVLNAGVARRRFEIFEKDEATITVNVVSTFLLALLLLPKMKVTATKFNTRPNLTIVASGVHFFAKFVEKDAPEGGIFDRLNENNGKVDMEERYRVSKLIDVLCTRAMCDHKSATQIPVTINCVEPGFCKSKLSREAGWGVIIMQFLLGRSTEKGSRALVHAASQGPETHGQFMNGCNIMKPSPFVLSKEGYVIQNRVWKELSAKLESVRPGVMQNLEGRG